MDWTTGISVPRYGAEHGNEEMGGVRERDGAGRVRKKEEKRTRQD